MFFAIIGPNNDGHDYLGQAGQKGCSAAAISDESKVPPDGDMALILVENTTKALQDLAAYYLSLLPLIKKDRSDRKRRQDQHKRPDVLCGFHQV